MVQNIKPNELIEKITKELKKIPEIKPPEWAAFVKTGVNKQRPPLQNDWWYVRAAAILRTVYIKGPIGVNKLRTKYGGKKNMGYKPDKVHKSSGNIIRKTLQQLQKAGFLIEEKKGIHKGRKMTKKGKDFLKNISNQIKPTKKEPQKKQERKEKAEKKTKEEKNGKVQTPKQEKEISKIK